MALRTVMKFLSYTAPRTLLARLSPLFDDDDDDDDGDAEEEGGEAEDFLEEYADDVMNGLLDT